MSTRKHLGIPRALGSTAAVALVVLLPAAAAAQNAYVQKNLVSDLPGMAQHLDKNLVNPWGVAFTPTSPIWVANNHTGTSTLYNGAGVAFPPDTPLIVTIPPPKNGMPPAAPTGMVFNPTMSFVLKDTFQARFIWATEDGTISGWNPMVDPTNAILKADRSEFMAIYKGLALGGNAMGPLLYATDFHNATVDVFNTEFKLTKLSSNFEDPDIPEGYAPFGIHLIGERLYVTYALQNEKKEDDVAGEGHGFVDVFNMSGKLVKRLISRGHLNSPWGLAVAPANFGAFSGALLVGNFGNGRINAYNLMTGQFLGTLKRPSGEPVVIKGLWSLQFGNGGTAGDTNTLLFTAGIPGDGKLEDHGLFGSLRVMK